MKGTLIAALTAFAVAGIAVQIPCAAAQELEPRSYVNTPVGLSFLLAGYGYTEGNVVFSAAMPVTDAKVETHSGVLGYIRSLDVAGLSGKLGVIVPYAAASGSAKLAGEPREREISGFADPRFRFSLNLHGAPAVTLEDLARYEQDLILGASLDVSSPLGQYDSSKLLNIGTNRWSVKPELGLSKALGRATLEASGAVTFFTPNNDFLNGRTLEQEPLYSVQGHLVYEFEGRLWAALDTTYYAGSAR
ncbi:MAG: transporter [Kiloniellales bacterium]